MFSITSNHLNKFVRLNSEAKDMFFFYTLKLLHVSTDWDFFDPELMTWIRLGKKKKHMIFFFFLSFL